jgi:hypothetical protein
MTESVHTARHAASLVHAGAQGMADKTLPYPRWGFQG